MKLFKKGILQHPVKCTVLSATTKDTEEESMESVLNMNVIQSGSQFSFAIKVDIKHGNRAVSFSFWRILQVHI